MEKEPTDADDGLHDGTTPRDLNATTEPKKGKRVRPVVRINEIAMETAKRALAQGRNMPKGSSREELLVGACLHHVMNTNQSTLALMII